MSILGGMFGKGDSQNDSMIESMIHVIEIVEKQYSDLCIRCCMIQVASGNVANIVVQEDYDNFIPRYGEGTEFADYFNLFHIDGYSDMYEIKVKPHINGNGQSFLRRLEEELKRRNISGFVTNSNTGTLRKNYQL